MKRNAVDSGLNHMGFHIIFGIQQLPKACYQKQREILSQTGYRDKAVFYDKQKYKEHATTEVTSE